MARVYAPRQAVRRGRFDAADSLEGEEAGMVLIGSILDLIVLGAAGRWMLPHVRRFLEAHGQVGPNYLGHTIPRGMGVVLWLLLWLQELVLQGAIRIESSGLTSEFLSLKELSSLEVNNRVFIFAATLIFLLGWTDDLIGSKAVKGLKGHFRYWMDSKTLSMGAVKALGTLSISAWLVFTIRNDQTPIWQMGVELILLILMTNTLNLLDVRPGRSLKAFLGSSCAVLLLGLYFLDLKTSVFFPMIPVFMGGLLLYSLDIRGFGMLGDAGANLLGFTLGYEIILILPWEAQVVIVAVIGFLHGQAEVSSITQMIEKNRILHWIDRLGRT
ncbi:hypothetical protein M5X11_07500 [Paenibacillus alginolyticus]|uniref:Uncharacterized protein n=1 Tax=Paenibacillus alginolyticus TaxID=59839 RepID=A0ABT4GDD0_9BACL|nr:hypothetical protein [Paenibacillus alginolyticus]MCY9664801.1 hypothetical protein [Paenibacillus alginolyticus]MCY9694119.1 hypothetical protein [Paenibacillus alginolyticus]MEC0143577.1 hypothetical protein [Paenibacillus alginolyticus]